MVARNFNHFVYAIARRVVERDRFYSDACKPAPRHIFVMWRGKIYNSSLQAPFRERPDISIMTKSDHPYEDDLVEAIREIELRGDVEASDDFDINGTYHLVHLDGSRLLPPTDEEAKYFREHATVNILEYITPL